MTTLHTSYAVRGIERATKGNGDTSLQRMTVISAGGTRTELLPSDPREVARILRERRAKSPAARAKARMTAAMKKRGIL